MESRGNKMKFSLCFKKIAANFKFDNQKLNLIIIIINIISNIKFNNNNN